MRVVHACWDPMALALGRSLARSNVRAHCTAAVWGKAQATPSTHTQASAPSNCPLLTPATRLGVP